MQLLGKMTAHVEAYCAEAEEEEAASRDLEGAARSTGRTVMDYDGDVVGAPGAGGLGEALLQARNPQVFPTNTQVFPRNTQVFPQKRFPTQKRFHRSVSP